MLIVSRVSLQGSVLALDGAPPPVARELLPSEPHFLPPPRLAELDRQEVGRNVLERGPRPRFGCCR